MTYTKSFKELNKTNADIAGGKGASLGEMINSGIPVPDGFVVLADTFEKFIKDTDLIQEIDAILNDVDHKAVHTVDEASEKIQDLIKQAKMPQDIADEVLSSFETLDAEFVAVRSSATAEDGADHAWAGQLDSYLNITKDNVLEKVQHCWASLFTPRAIFYRFEKGLNTTKISVAVVVQKMVNSEKSGIAFSVHPVTEDRNQLIIEAGLGLGEAIVSGSITPDAYVVEKKPRNILDVNVAEQSRGLFRKSDYGNEWIELGEKGKEQILSEDQINELAELIIKIENHYGFPCDIEWAFENGKFFIVQSRPITTLSQESGGNSPEVVKYKYFGFWPSPPLAAWYWIDWESSKYHKIFSLDNLTKGSVFCNGGHYLIREKDYKELKNKIVNHLNNNDGFFSDFKHYSNECFDHYDKIAENTNWNPENKADFRKLLELGLPVTFFWVFGHLISEILQEVLDEYLKNNKEVRFIPQMLKPSSETMMERYLFEIRKIKGELFSNNNQKQFNVENVLYLLKKENGGAIDKILTEYEWIRSFKFSRISLSLEDVAKDILEIGTKNDEDIRLPNETKLKNIIQSYNDVAYARNKSAEKFSHFSYNVSKNILTNQSNKLKIKYDNLLLFTPDELSEIFFDNKNKFKDKQEARLKNVWLLIRDDESVKIYDGSIADRFYNKNIKPQIEIDNDVEIISGYSANEGFVKATVCVVRDNKDFSKFKKGDVLVTTMTTPDFVVLMKTASAIVTDIGGFLTHAAIVSRELNIPCIVGTKFATKILNDGDMVEVDAENGVVRKIN